MTHQKNTKNLPSGYAEVLKLDLQKDTKKALLVNVLALILAAVMFVPAFFLRPFSIFLSSSGAFPFLAKTALLLLGMVLYLVLHELVHGVAMKVCLPGVKVRYGFTGLYAYAASQDAYFCKSSYILIALAPVVLWGAVLLILNLVVSADWFWVIYFIQIINISGAAGDLYMVYRLSGMSSEILVHDDGVSMVIFAPDELQK